MVDFLSSKNYLPPNYVIKSTQTIQILSQQLASIFNWYGTNCEIRLEYHGGLNAILLCTQNVIIMSSNRMSVCYPLVMNLEVII